MIAGSQELELAGLAAASNSDRLVAQARDAKLEARRALRTGGRATGRRGARGHQGPRRRHGVRELIASSDADLVLNAIVGIAGLGPTIVALTEGVDLALANKESLVVGGELVTALAEATGAGSCRSTPSTRRSSSCSTGTGPGDVERLIVTASGGPFRGRTDLAGVSAEEALAHPTWEMGGRITIDSATLMNKGLEVIEAHHLFGVGVRADRRRRPPAVDRPLADRAQRRCPARPPRPPRHAGPDLLRAPLSPSAPTSRHRRSISPRSAS